MGPLWATMPGLNCGLSPDRQTDRHLEHTAEGLFRPDGETSICDVHYMCAFTPKDQTRLSNDHAAVFAIGMHGKPRFTERSMTVVSNNELTVSERSVNVREAGISMHSNGKLNVA